MSIPRGKREGAAGCKPLYPLRAESASGSAGDVEALRMASVTAAPSDKREWNREVFFASQTMLSERRFFEAKCNIKEHIKEK